MKTNDLEAYHFSLSRAIRPIAECRDFALSAQEPFGIWGGLSEENRMNLRAKIAPLTTVINNEIRGIDLWLNKISG